MNMTKLVLCVALLGISVVSRGADLMQVYQQARVKDATYAAAKQHYKAVSEARPLARSSLLPQINLSANVAQNNDRFGNFAFAGLPLPNSQFNYASDGYT